VFRLGNQEESIGARRWRGAQPSVYGIRGMRLNIGLIRLGVSFGSTRYAGAHHQTSATMTTSWARRRYELVRLLLILVCSDAFFLVPKQRISSRVDFSLFAASRVQPLTVGPILGATTTSGARIFGRGNGEKQCIGVARIRREDQSNYSEERSFRMTPTFDKTGVAVFSDLQDLTKYSYQMGYVEQTVGSNLDWSALDWSRVETHSFRTATANRKQKRSFVFGSCRYLLKLLGGSFFDDRGDKTFRSIGEQIDSGIETDALLMLGDQIYADDLNFFRPDIKLPQFFQRYRDVFSQDYIRALMARVPTYMTLDDHEIEDNWPAKATRKDEMTLYPAAIHSYLTYQMSHSPLFDLDGNHISGIPTKLWYTFQDGCCDFFITDSRTERKLDESNRKMISTEQMTALKEWLSDGAEAVKFVATPTPMFPDAESPSEDTWSGFIEQRNEILNYIQERKIPRVIFLSGDVHCSMCAKLTCTTDSDFSVLSLISSAFYWPYPNSWEPQVEGPLYESNERYQVEGASLVVRDDNFSRVTVTLDDITCEVFDRKGKSLSKTEYPLGSNKGSKTAKPPAPPAAIPQNAATATKAKTDAKPVTPPWTPPAPTSTSQQKDATVAESKTTKPLKTSWNASPPPATTQQDAAKTKKVTPFSSPGTPPTAPVIAQKNATKTTNSKPATPFSPPGTPFTPSSATQHKNATAMKSETSTKQNATATTKVKPGKPISPPWTASPPSASTEQKNTTATKSETGKPMPPPWSPSTSSAATQKSVQKNATTTKVKAGKPFSPPWTASPPAASTEQKNTTATKSETGKPMPPPWTPSTSSAATQKSGQKNATTTKVNAGKPFSPPWTASPSSASAKQNTVKTAEPKPGKPFSPPWESSSPAPTKKDDATPTKAKTDKPHPTPAVEPVLPPSSPFNIPLKATATVPKKDKSPSSPSGTSPPPSPPTASTPSKDGEATAVSGQLTGMEGGAENEKEMPPKGEPEKSENVSDSEKASTTAATAVTPPPTPENLTGPSTTSESAQAPPFSGTSATKMSSPPESSIVTPTTTPETDLIQQPPPPPETVATTQAPPPPQVGMVPQFVRPPDPPEPENPAEGYVATDKFVYAVGETIDLIYKVYQPQEWDYIAIFPASISKDDLHHSNASQWMNTCDDDRRALRCLGGSLVLPLKFPASSPQRKFPLSPGDYVAYFLRLGNTDVPQREDIIAECPFKVI
jgi:alkaline phosphatase D